MLRKKIFNLVNYNVRLYFLVPLLYFFYFPFEFNLDYLSYKINYDESYWRYDILYVAFSQLLKNFFDLSYDQFLFTFLAFTLLILAGVYKKGIYIVLAYPVLISLSQHFFGTQIRFAFASSIFLLALTSDLKTKNKLILYVVSCLFHYGIFFGVIAVLVSKNINHKYLMFKSYYFWLSLLILIFLFLFSANVVDYVIGYTRFAYYTVDSDYMASRSVISIIYLVVMTIYFLLVFNIAKERKIVESQVFFVFLLLLISSLASSSLAVFSGRINLLVFLLEPIVMYSVFKCTSIPLLFRLFGFFVIYSRLVFEIVTMKFYLFSLGLV